ncbi:bifunctional oligoribonuclease/PAP phosphatase NrnA [Flavobacterium piscinae]|uniref:Bifunctional oligoribonuclease/PAP phosphatase NrnA n=1 Tax=Flavobacterium piscinae TaxID=2506424 RepID=A0A4Q1KQA5_9FLAO|nr:bifunctional oligoribonuclease/PAP phosphatase NrnA [Flavobacterium piscinae]RXR32177.1 bifunctional oligoribonuclease/PAP phosphatase NrnA [Flavobacterium piscinae]
MEENLIIEAKKLLQSSKKIAIIPHRNPDGDAMGSTLALYHFLKKLNHQPVVISPNEFPDFLAWLPESQNVLIYEKDRNGTKNILEKAELIFTLDFNALHRTGEMENVLNTLQVPLIMIDHHQAPDTYAKVTFSDTRYGSTCEMIYDFIKSFGNGNYLDKTIATCIYTGIVTDSGSFKFPKTTGKTHRIVADLIDLGIENTEIHNLLFNNNTYESLQLLGKALQNLRVIKDHKTSYITLTQEELDLFNYKKGDTEGIVNYGLSIKDVIFTAIFIENKEEGIIKISLRSLGDFDVNQLSREHFNGGGHNNAAGGKSMLSMEDTIKQFENVVKNHPKLKF